MSGHTTSDGGESLSRIAGATLAVPIILAAALPHPEEGIPWE